LQYTSAEAELPLVGDWVAAEVLDVTQAVIHSVLPRLSLLGRLEGLIAANIDELAIVTGLDGNFNLRRALRLATLARAGGMQPVLVLSKADLPGAAAKIAKARDTAGETPLIVLSSRTGLGVAALASRWREGQTIALVGSSGVGKTTLVNRLLGWELPTAEVGVDSRGRHTTTSRQLYRLPSGALLMDMPGVRAVGLSGSVEDLNEEFRDIAAVARLCKFSDCRHEYEPGCEVRAALESGELDEGRWVAYRKQERELRYLERRDDPALQRANRDTWKTIHLQNRRFSKEGRSRSG
jgi:ribosome biogenesis GTPase